MAPRTPSGAARSVVHRTVHSCDHPVSMSCTDPRHAHGLVSGSPQGSGVDWVLHGEDVPAPTFGCGPATRGTGVSRRWGAAGRPASGIRRAGPVGARGATGRSPRPPPSEASPSNSCSTRLASWAGRTRTSRGPSWRPRSPAGCATGRASPAARRRTAGTRRRGRRTAARTSRPPAWPASESGVAVRRAALPLELQLPRRRRAPGGAGRAGGRAGAGGGRAHRPRRDVRRGPFRRGRPRARHPHRVRGRAEHGPVRAAERCRGPGGRAPAAARPRTARGTGRCAARSPPPSCAARRRGARSTTWTRSSRTPRGMSWCSPAAARARCRGRWSATGPRRPPRSWSGWSTLFGRENVRVELTRYGLPTDTERNDALAALAADAGVATVATTAAHYARPDRAPLAAAMAAVRARRSLDEIDPWLPPAGTAHLRSRRGDGRPVRGPPSRCRRPGRGARAGAGVRADAGGPGPAAVRRAAGPHGGDLAARADPARRDASVMAATTRTRPRCTWSSTSWRSSSRRTSPATS